MNISHSLSYYCLSCHVRHAIGYRCKYLRSVKDGNVVSFTSLAVTRKVGAL